MLILLLIDYLIKDNIVTKYLYELIFAHSLIFIGSVILIPCLIIWIREMIEYATTKSFQYSKIEDFILKISYDNIKIIDNNYRDVGDSIIFFVFYGLVCNIFISVIWFISYPVLLITLIVKLIRTYNIKKSEKNSKKDNSIFIMEKTFISICCCISNYP